MWTQPLTAYAINAQKRKYYEAGTQQTTVAVAGQREGVTN
jgi:hypothetical protein